MIINHNLNSMNAHRNMSFNTNQTGKAMEKLSSGLRINRAGDDAAGLAISEKMRGQIRGLEQATRNSQDGISLIQTAEGALNETHSILQRMRELAVQSSNDTNVGVDREEIQKEINQLSSEINRVGNTTEFNTQSLLKGNGKENLTPTGLSLSDLTTVTNGFDAFSNEAKISVDLTEMANGENFKVQLNGKELTINFTSGVGQTQGAVSGITPNSASISVGTADLTATNDTVEKAVADTLQSLIDADEQLKGNYKVSIAANEIVIEATKEGEFSGSKGSISYTATATAVAQTDSDYDGAIDDAVTAGSPVMGRDVAATSAVSTLNLSSLTTDAQISNLIGKGLTVEGQQIEFYDSSKGAYAGKAIGVDVSDALEASANKEQALASTIATQLSSKLQGVTVSAAPASANLSFTTSDKGASASVEIKDGGINEKYVAKLQVGANKGQSMEIEIADMRATALGITGKVGDAGFTSKSNVTNGTNSQATEAALDVSTADKASSAVEVINKAIETVSAQRSNLGSFQNRLEHTINNLSTSAENLQAAESRIRDVDMAKEMMNFTKNNILNQAAQAMMAQSNQQPQAVLQLLR